MENFHVSFPGLGINNIEISRVAISIGDFKIYFYGLLIAIGLILAIVFVCLSYKYFGINKDKYLDCVIVGAITGVIGARLYYVLFKLDMYKDNPIEMLNIRDGGLAIYGAIIGGLLGGLITAKILKQKFLPILDITFTGFLIGQAFGRWGNFFNQEAFGTETNFIFRMVSEGTGNVPVHPCYLYESTWCLLSFIFLVIFNRYYQKYDGQCMFIYFILYGFERMIVEGLRTDSLYLGLSLFGYQVRVSQALSFVLFIVGIVMLIIFRKKDDGIKERNQKLRLERREKKNANN